MAASISATVLRYLLSEYTIKSSFSTLTFLGWSDLVFWKIFRWRESFGPHGRDSEIAVPFGCGLELGYFVRGAKLAFVFTLVVLRRSVFQAFGFSLRTVVSP